MIGKVLAGAWRLPLLTLLHQGDEWFGEGRAEALEIIAGRTQVVINHIE
jgi:hypothetical protein